MITITIAILSFVLGICINIIRGPILTTVVEFIDHGKGIAVLHNRLDGFRGTKPLKDLPPNIRDGQVFRIRGSITVSSIKEVNNV